MFRVHAVFTTTKATIWYIPGLFAPTSNGGGSTGICQSARWSCFGQPWILGRGTRLLQVLLQCSIQVSYFWQRDTR